MVYLEEILFLRNNGRAVPLRKWYQLVVFVCSLWASGDSNYVAVVIKYKSYSFHLNQSFVILCPPSSLQSLQSFFSMKVVILFDIFNEGLLCARQYAHVGIQEKYGII